VKKTIILSHDQLEKQNKGFIFALAFARKHLG
jgi:hypothetical protein